MSLLKPLFLSVVIAGSAMLVGCGHHHRHSRHRDWDDNCRPARYDRGPKYITNDRGYYERNDYRRRCD